MKTDGEIKEAMDVLYKISGDKDAIMLAEMREKALMDEQSRLNGARKEGVKKGVKEGKIEVAKNFLKMGMSIEQISMGTGLTIEEVEKLKNNIKKI